MEEKVRIQDFIKQISESLDDREAYDKFRACFRTYKMSQLMPNIDEFVHKLFDCFLGDAEHAVCHLEVQNYAKKKIILLKLADQVQQRHRDRYEELITCHLQACEAKPRTHHNTILGKNSHAQKTISKLRAQAVQAAQEAGELRSVRSSQQQLLSQSESNALYCCICYKSENLYEAKCHHVACLGCWEAWLIKALECPTCRQRTRRNQIYPIEEQQPQKSVKAALQKSPAKAMLSQPVASPMKEQKSPCKLNS